MAEVKFKQTNDPQPGPVPCVNPECDEMVSAGTGTSVSVTYPSGSPDYGWLCARCTKLKL
jgi:hypothetical protein